MADRLEEIKERERLATPGIWRVWDSCAWRRIGIDDQQRKVIEPMNDSDGHPNLYARREDLEFAAHARQDVPWLLAELAQAKADLAKFKSDLEQSYADHHHQLRRAEAAEAALGERERVIDDAHVLLRDIVAALRKEPAVQGVKYDELGHRANSMIRRLGLAIAPPQAEKPKEPCRNLTHTRADGTCFDCGRPVENPKPAKGANEANHRFNSIGAKKKKKKKKKK